MSNNYRGKDTPGGASGFVAIDEDEGLGDGSTTYSVAASTGKQNRILGNTMYLADGPRTSCFAPVVNNSSDTAATGDRPWASIEWTSIGLWLIPVARGFAGVRLGGVYNVQGNGSEEAGVRLKVQFGGLTNIVDLANTRDGGPQYTSIFPSEDDGTFLLPQPITDNEGGFVRLFLWVQSRDDGARSGATVNTFLRNWYTESQGATSVWDDATSGNPFAANSMETQYLRLTADEPFTGKRWDLLSNINAVAAGASAVSIYPADSASNSALSAQQFYMSFLQLRGLWIRPVYQRTSAINLPRAALEAQLPYSGPVVQRQARALRRIHARPRLLAVGPRGQLNLDANFEKYTGIDYPYRWPFVDGDGGTLTLIEESIFVDTKNPTVHCELLVIAVAHRQPLVNALLEGTGLKPSWPGFQGLAEEANYDAENAGVGSATWTVTLKIDQLVDVASPGTAAWDDLDSRDNKLNNEDTDSDNGEEVDVRLPLFGGAYEAKEPFLRQQAFLEAHDPATTDLSFGYKEGSLFPQDESLMTRVTIEAQMGNFTPDGFGRPLRVRIQAALNQDQPINYPSSHFNDIDKLRFVIVGYTITEIPQDE